MFPSRGEQFTSLILKFKNLDACPSHTYRNLDGTRFHTHGLHHAQSCSLAAYLRLFRGNHRAMARCAVLGRGLVKEYRFPTDHLDVLMTGPAPYVLMRSL